jgi:hypothetical protein
VHDVDNPATYLPLSLGEARMPNFGALKVHNIGYLVVHEVLPESQ